MLDNRSHFANKKYRIYNLTTSNRYSYYLKTACTFILKTNLCKFKLYTFFNLGFFYLVFK